MKAETLKACIIQAIRNEYPNLPDEFYGSQLARRVMMQIGLSKYKHRKPYTDTILRYFRELRQSEIKCICTNREKSIYVKN